MSNESKQVKTFNSPPLHIPSTSSNHASYNMALLVAILFGISQVQASVECIDNFETYQSNYIEPILHKLKAKNYTIHNGTIFWVTNVTKHGGSPATTYGFWDINTSATFHNHQRLKPNPETPWSMLFHSSDAILWSGCTPPKASYVGITNYAFAKYRGHKTHPNGPNITEDVTNRTESVVFSSMNSAVNQYFANTDTKSSKAYGDIWDSRMTVITTGDQVTYNDIYDEYSTAGLTDQVNNIWIPESLFQFIPYNFTKRENDYDVWNYPGPIDSFCPCYRIIDPLNDPDYWEYVSYKQPVYWITAEKLRPDDAVKPRKVFTEIPTRNITGYYYSLHIVLATYRFPYLRIYSYIVRISSKYPPQQNIYINMCCDKQRKEMSLSWKSRCRHSSMIRLLIWRKNII